GGTYSSRIVMILKVKTHEKSFSSCRLPFAYVSDLRKYISIPLPITKIYPEFNDKFIKIWESEVAVGENPTIHFLGNDMTIFMLKLRRIYDDIVFILTNPNPLVFFYY